MFLPEAAQVPTTPSVAQVEGQKEELLAQAPLVCYAVVYPTGERRMACEVAEVRWWLLTTTPSLKVAPLTYVVALPGERVFYSVTFAEDTPPEVRHPLHNTHTRMETHCRLSCCLWKSSCRRKDNRCAFWLRSFCIVPHNAHAAWPMTCVI